MRLWLLAICSVCLFSSAALAQCDQGEQQIRFPLADGEKSGIRFDAAGKLKQALDQALQGRACLKFVTGKSTQTDVETLTALANSNIDMAAPAFSALGEKSLPYKTFSLPFAFRDDHALRRFHSANRAAFDLALKSRQLVGLEIWDGHFAQLSAKRRVILPVDMRGLRLRQDAGGATRQFIAAISATSAKVDEEELFDAVKDGRIEAQAGSWAVIDSKKLLTVQAQITQTNHHTYGYQLLVSAKWWNTLDPTIKTGIRAVAKQVSAESNTSALALANRAKSRLLRLGKPVRALTEKQRAVWLAAFAAQYRAFDEAGGAALLKALKKANAAP